MQIRNENKHYCKKFDVHIKRNLCKCKRYLKHLMFVKL